MIILILKLMALQMTLGNSGDCGSASRTGDCGRNGKAERAGTSGTGETSGTSERGENVNIVGRAW